VSDAPDHATAHSRYTAVEATHRPDTFVTFGQALLIRRAWIAGQRLERLGGAHLAVCICAFMPAAMGDDGLGLR